MSIKTARYLVRWFHIFTDALMHEKTFPEHYFVEACIAAREEHPECWATLWDNKMRKARDFGESTDIMQDNIDHVRSHKEKRA